MFSILNEILYLEFNLSSESLFHVKFQNQSKWEHPPIMHTYTHTHTETNTFPKDNIDHRISIQIGNQLCWFSLRLYNIYYTTLRSGYSSQHHRKEKNHFIPNALLLLVVSDTSYKIRTAQRTWLGGIAMWCWFQISLPCMVVWMPHGAKVWLFRDVGFHFTVVTVAYVAFWTVHQCQLRK